MYVEQQYPLHCWPFVLGIDSLLVTGSEGDRDSSQEMGSQRGLDKGEGAEAEREKIPIVFMLLLINNLGIFTNSALWAELV